jgi:hypothetical protein
VELDSTSHIECSIALLDGGKCIMFGSNKHGEFGNGSAPSKSVPTSLKHPLILSHVIKVQTQLATHRKCNATLVIIEVIINHVDCCMRPKLCGCSWELHQTLPLRREYCIGPNITQGENCKSKSVSINSHLLQTIHVTVILFTAAANINVGDWSCLAFAKRQRLGLIGTSS